MRNTTNTDNVRPERIAQLMLASAGFYNDDVLVAEYGDPYYETAEEFTDSISSQIDPFVDSADGRTLDTKSYVEPYIRQTLFGEKIDW